MAKHRIARWLRNVAPDAQMAALSGIAFGLVYSVKAGVGIGPLPLRVDDPELDLVRVIELVAELNRSWRLLTTRTCGAHLL